ncbi:hypothetical protein [Bradyrhizobium sp. USDA 4529]
MSRKQSEAQAAISLNRIIRVLGRTGLAMAGAMCGTFIAAQLTRTSEAFDSEGMIALTILLGAVAFYLGIDVPRQRRFHSSAEKAPIDKIEFLSATGTFLATLCALISVYALVFDEELRSGWAVTVGLSWVLGIAMQIGAGLVGRGSRMVL